jgi:hypothetical protein
MLRSVRVFRVAAFAIGLSMLVSTTSIEGHHSIGCAYDTTALRTITGRITEIVWKFPHVHFRLDGADDSTARIEWDVETVNPGGLSRRGVEINTLRIGETLMTSAWMAKDGSR